MAIETEKPTAPVGGFVDFGNHSPPYIPVHNGHGHQSNGVIPNGHGHPASGLPVSHTVINVSSSQPAASVVYMGGCPSCRVGVLRKSHCTFCGILWSILLFPFGLLCLCCCTKDRCSHCSYTQ